MVGLRAAHQFNEQPGVRAAFFHLNNLLAGADKFFFPLNNRTLMHDKQNFTRVIRVFVGHRHFGRAVVERFDDERVVDIINFNNIFGVHCPKVIAVGVKIIRIDRQINRDDGSAGQQKKILVGGNIARFVVFVDDHLKFKGILGALMGHLHFGGALTFGFNRT